MVSERWFNRLVIAAVTLGFALLVVAAGLAAWTTRQTQSHTQWVAHTYEVQRAISDVYAQQLRREAARRGYLLDDDPRIVRAFREASAAIRPRVERLAGLTRDNPVQQRNIAELRSLFTRYTAQLNQSMGLAARGQRDRARAEFATDGSLDQVLAIRAQILRMTDEERRLLTIRNARQAGSVHLFYLSVGLALFLLVLVAASSIWVILRYTRDLSQSRGDLRRLNEDLEGAVRERTVDLQRANDEIQRFAYIVSHDLRSPLVNVMGFTSELEAATKTLGSFVERVEVDAPALADTDARVAAREDLPEAIGFIRTSTQKMDRLINAILRLSREGRRTITPERIDMEALARSVADSLHHRADDLGAAIDVDGPMPTIVSDRLGIEQILSNLIENAVKYLKPGRPGVIQVRGRRLPDGRAQFDVADNGRGIDPRDHERVFDLFRRSGVQDQPGEGIGLAHVRAMAYRLGGTISVESALDEGATFRLTLPMTYSAEQGMSA